MEYLVTFKVGDNTSISEVVTARNENDVFNQISRKYDNPDGVSGYCVPIPSHSPVPSFRCCE